MNWTSTDYVAWWGAIVATAVLVWDIYKFKSAKSILLLRASHIVSPDGRLEVEIANIGNKETTLTRVYANAGLGAKIEDSRERIVIPSGGARTGANFEDRFSLPYMLTPGAVWRGWINPEHIDYINDLDSIIVKVRDERGKLAVRYETFVPREWRKPNSKAQRGARPLVEMTKAELEKRREYIASGTYSRVEDKLSGLLRTGNLPSVHKVYETLKNSDLDHLNQELLDVLIALESST